MDVRIVSSEAMRFGMAGQVHIVVGTGGLAPNGERCESFQAIGGHFTLAKLCCLRSTWRGFGRVQPDRADQGLWVHAGRVELRMALVIRLYTCTLVCTVTV